MLYIRGLIFVPDWKSDYERSYATERSCLNSFRSCLRRSTNPCNSSHYLAKPNKLVGIPPVDLHD